MLSPGGLLVNQCGVPFMQAEELRNTRRSARCVFAHVTAYVAAVPTYVGGFMTHGHRSDQPITPLRRRSLTARARQPGMPASTSYWSPAVHEAAFALPPYIAATLES